MILVRIRGGGAAERDRLTRALVSELRERGQSVSVIAYAGASAAIDIPGKDSYEHRRAGAREVLAVSRLRWALVHEAESPVRPTLTALLARLRPVDIVLAPGCAEEADINLDLKGDGQALRAAHSAGVGAPFRLDMAGQIADFILSPPAEKQPRQ